MREVHGHCSTAGDSLQNSNAKFIRTKLNNYSRTSIIRTFDNSN